MNKKNITKLIGFGILIFLTGFVLSSFGVIAFQWLIPLGAIMNFLGIYFFFKSIDLGKEFEFKTGDDFLTYFWNVLVLKIWTFIFSVWMVIMIIELINHGHI